MFEHGESNKTVHSTVAQAIGALEVGLKKVDSIEDQAEEIWKLVNESPDMRRIMWKALNLGESEGK